MLKVAQDSKESGSTSSALIQALEDDILHNVLKPGDRLDEQALAKRFEVSRTPVREALRHLASSGLVEIRRNQGAMVRRLTTTELIEMFQVMAELEGLCARLCARRMSEEELAEMRKHNTVCEERAAAGDHDGFFDANTDFHETIYTGARSTYLQDEVRKLRNRVNVYRRHITFQPRRMTRTVAEHWKIVKAIEAGEEDDAHQFMREHVDLLAGSAADVLLTLEAKNSS
ncbi:GntR family transcriptional regulator [Nitratireductor soli]|uniref:GntR family transcriptional regulator n=1 Tax=Nitratireductor soli TaxID=1670619 RepID=UPI00065E1CA6|nr:GntR family transcriptional regulator [Nitratireductor soli]